MDVWLEARPKRYSEIRELCEIGAEVGVTGLAFNEVKSPPDLAAAIAFSHAPQLRVVTSMLIAFPRSPMVTAYNTWHLQAYSQGRYELGLGTQVKGHIERRFSTPWAAPKQRMREYMEVLRATWATWERGAPLDVQGDNYQVTLMTDDFNPGPIGLPSPMIHTSAVNEGMCELAGEISDGLIMAEPITQKYTDEVMIPAIDRGLAKAGRSRQDLTIMGGGYIGLGETDDEIEQVREHIRYRIAFYSSTRTYRRPLETHGWSEVSEPLHRLSMEQRWDELPKYISDEMLDTFAVIGRYDEVGERLKERYGHYADRIYVGPFLSKSVTAKNLKQLTKSLAR